MMTMNLYVDVNSTYVTCGRCSKSVRAHRRHIKIYRGGSYGVGKSFHMLCALLELNEGRKLIMNAIKTIPKGRQTRLMDL